MTRPLATSMQMVESKLVNRKPALCPVCDRHVAPFTGLPVILSIKGQIIEFIHPGCCATDESPELDMPPQKARQSGISRS